MDKIKEFGFPAKGLWKFYYKDNDDRTLANWTVDFAEEIVDNVNIYTDSFMEKPFGDISIPTFADFFWFMNRRVWAKNYDGLQDMYTNYNCHPRNRFTLLLAVHGHTASDTYHVDWEVVHD